MADTTGSTRLKTTGWSAHWKGHVFLFDKRIAPAHDAPAGARLILIAVALEGARLALVRWLPHFLPPLWLLIPILLGVALLSIRFVGQVRYSEIGLYRWRDWSDTEKSYFVQVMVIANVVFPVVLASRLRLIFSGPSMPGVVWKVFLPYLFYGFYQELVYRGLLQTVLVRRWGAWRGILASNALFTFGPLHYLYFYSGAASALPMFAAIFAIGLLFGVLYWRSGNLWIVGTMHAVGNSYLVGGLGASG